MIQPSDFAPEHWFNAATGDFWRGFRWCGRFQGFLFTAIPVEGPNLVKKLKAAGVCFDGKQRSDCSSRFLFTVMMIVPINLIFFLLSRGMALARKSIIGLSMGSLCHLVTKETRGNLGF